MALTTVLSVEVRPDRSQRYEALVRELAGVARRRRDAFHWNAYQTLFGPAGRLHFAAGSPDFAALSECGSTEQMIARVLGPASAARFAAETAACTLTRRIEISIERPELGYVPRPPSGPAPIAVVTAALARTGCQGACESLLHRVAEALPKVGDPGSLHCYQTLVGNLAQYWTVRPLADVADLDTLLPVPELLERAFGEREGGRIHRAGLDALERVERSIVIHREDLSNPP